MGAPQIGGDTTGTVEEDSLAVITGTLQDIGFLSGTTDDSWMITSAASYGAASIDPSTGVWTYDLDDSNPAVDALDAGDTLTDLFTVRMDDADGGFDTQVVTITITGAPCYRAGTLIATPQGEVPIEDLRIGDWVQTAEGPACVRWAGCRTVSAAEMEVDASLAPVRIAAGALGPGLPRRDLWVSRQHRMLVASPIVARMTGQAGVLIPAFRLAGLPGIHVDTSVASLAYHHLLLDRHAVLLAEGAPAESLFPGDELDDLLDAADLAAIDRVVPRQTWAACAPACPIPPGPVIRQMVERHQRNGVAPLHKWPGVSSPPPSPPNSP